jgi:curved DNA-binding protein CbpA
MPIISYYDILGVHDDASVEVIAAAYRKKIKQWHPDVCRLPHAEDKMKMVNEAAGVLLDPLQRQEYDSSLARELSWFRKATFWAREEQTNNYHAHTSAHHKPSFVYARKPRKAPRKYLRISQETIRYSAGFCAAGFVLLVLVVAGFTAITSLDAVPGVSNPSLFPESAITKIPSGSAPSAIEQGDELFEAGDYAGSLMLYDTVIAADPDLQKKEVWYNRGIAQNVLGHYQDASQSFDRVLALSPEDPLVLAQKGAALIGLGKYDDALDYTDKALAGNSEAAWIWKNRAIALTNLGQQKEARAAFDNAGIFTSGRSGY